MIGDRTYNGGYTNLQSQNGGYRPDQDLTVAYFGHDNAPIDVQPEIVIDPEDVNPNKKETKKQNKLLLLAAAVLGIYNILG